MIKLPAHPVDAVVVYAPKGVTTVPERVAFSDNFQYANWCNLQGASLSRPDSTVPPTFIHELAQWRVRARWYGPTNPNLWTVIEFGVPFFGGSSGVVNGKFHFFPYSCRVTRWNANVYGAIATGYIGRNKPVEDYLDKIIAANQPNQQTPQINLADDDPQGGTDNPPPLQLGVIRAPIIQVAHQAGRTHMTLLTSMQ